MTAREFHRLRAYSYASKHKFTPANRPPSRRSAKNARNGVGMKFLKNGGIVSEVSLERVFVEKGI